MSTTNHRNPRLLKLTTLLIAMLSMAASMFASKAIQPGVDAVPVVRVTSKIDNTVRTALSAHVPVQIKNAADLGRLDPKTPMNHLIMVLQPTVEQDHAMRTLIDQQSDKSTPYFHKWLTPDQIGAKYGVADSDISAITGWLTSQGMTIDHVSKSKRFIQFSGTVGQVESAFNTEMHSVNVKGAAHVSNVIDASVPAALRPVIRSVPTLNDFFKTSGVSDEKVVVRSRPAPVEDFDSEPADVRDGKFYCHEPIQVHVAPDFSNGATNMVGSGDIAAIYNTNPLLAMGNDGTGISIGVIARTDIHLQDVQTFRQFWGLKPNDPTFVIVGEDPGVVGGDDIESYLDAEVSGGTAPGAHVDFITSRATLTVDGVDLSAMYAVENNLTDIITESYNSCEAVFVGSGIQDFEASMWEQAAAQGQTVFVSTGDEGPAGCNANANSETTGYAVGGLASSPFNVAVGGTEFDENLVAGTFWNAGATPFVPPAVSATGYIPEAPWNESRNNDLGIAAGSGIGSGGGGVSSYFALPPWQRGFGVPSGADPAYFNLGAVQGLEPNPTTPINAFTQHRYLPDVSMNAASSHDGTVFCGEGVCELASDGSINQWATVGGTSVAAPTMAGVQALIDQFNGGRQGQANYVYYALADAQHTAALNCNAAGPPAAGCAFNDVQFGDINICETTACGATAKIGWSATPGYDLATGLGSPNVNNLATLWNTVTFRSTTTALSVSMTPVVHGSNVTVSGTVAPGSGTGTPTGDVAFIASTGSLTDPVDINTGGFLNPMAIATLDINGNYSIPNLTNLPGGSFNLIARYSGDGTFASSTSIPVAVVVDKEDSTLNIEPNAFTCAGGEVPATTFPYGSYVWTDYVVAGDSSQGTPTGTVTVTDNANPLATLTLNSNGVAHSLAGQVGGTATSCVSGFTIQDVPPLAGGSHTLAASYSGDSSFNASTASPVGITITQAAIPATLTTSATNIASGSAVTLSLTFAGLASAGPGTARPTGTVTFTDTTTSTTLGTATLGAAPTSAIAGATAILTTSSITTSGANSITATWAGDSNYTLSAAPAPVTVTVQAGTATTLTLTSNANPAALGGRPTFTATMGGATLPTSGAVSFYDGSVLLGTGNVSATTHLATFRPAATVVLAAGVHTINATWAGTATLNSSSGSLSQTFNQIATAIQLTAKLNGTWGQAFSMGATMGNGNANYPPTGGVTFFDGATAITSPQAFFPPPAGGFGLFQTSTATPPGVAGVTTGVLTAGMHTITATYPGDTNYAAANTTTTPAVNTQIINVAQATPVMTVIGGSFVYDGNPHTGSGTATGGAGETLPVVLTYDGISAPYGPTTTAPSAAGVYSVTASTVGDSNNTSNSLLTSLSISATPPSISPNTGSVNGGLAVTITGVAFVNGATVTIGGNAATDVVFVNSTTLTAVTPAGTLGAQDVTVTNPDSSQATETGGFTYVAQVFDPNGDGTVDTADIFYLVDFLFMDGPAPIGSGDANGDMVVDPADIFYLINALFLGGPMPQAKTPTPLVTESLGTMSGSVSLGNPVFNEGRYLIPVIVNSTTGSIAPQAMSLQLHFNTEGAIGSVTVGRDGAVKNVNPAFETSRQSGNNVSYLVSFSGNVRLGGVVAQIVVPAFDGQRVAVSLDPALTMLTDQRGMIKASVAGKTLTVSGTSFGGDSTPATRIQQ